jgi:molecular chaperone DnaJ
MAAKRDYYEILNIPRDSDPDGVKKAYRKLALKYHPDKNPGDKDAEEQFKAISEAYEVLSDPEKRARYDQFGHAAFDRTAGGYSDFGINLEEALRTFMGAFGGGGSIFDDLFGSFDRRRDARRRGADLRFDLQITFEEAVLGSEKTFTVPRNQTCSHCEGKGAEPGTSRSVCPDCRGIGQIRVASGFFSISQTCDRCGGTGEVIQTPCRECRGRGLVPEKRTISIKVPAGVENGSRVRLTGEGEGGLSGTPPGDLYVVLHVLPHDIFERHGDDLYCELPIAFTVAALGGTVDAPTLNGAAKLKIPPGTQNGALFRLRNQGVRRLNSRSRGDLHVRVLVEVPSNLNSDQKEKLEAFAQACGDEVNPIRQGFLEKARRLFQK